jgi:DNA polymerase-3 subunit alpha (Gram-positive type)
MVYLVHAGLEPQMAFQIMERVRKGAWNEMPEAERARYLSEMRKNKIPDWYIESCTKIKYMFPKAHAAAYVLMALRIAYFKVHYPCFYYCAYFSVRANDFDLVAMAGGANAVKARVEEIQQKGVEASNKEKNLMVVLEICNEMLERGLKFSKIDLYRSDAKNFVIDGDTLIPPFRAMDSLGENVAQNIMVAREEGEFLSKEDLRVRAGVSKTLIEKMSEQGILDGLPEENQLSLFEELF